MKKIILPTDFSANAWNAICYTLQAFKEVRCKFYVLNTYSPALYRFDYNMGGPSFTGIEDPIRNNSLNGVAQVIADAKEQYPNNKHSYEPISAFNILTDEINELVEKEDIDLVIMGTQGATGAKEIFFGSNAVYVMRKSNCPVLAIPESYHFHGIKHILFPTDYLTFYKRKELKELVDMAKKYEAQITTLYVSQGTLSENQMKDKEFLNECFEQLPHDFKNVEGTSIAKAITEYIISHDFEMLAMMYRKHSFIERLLMKQNVDNLGFHIKIPFLVMPDTSKVLDK